jgi:uncharacterized protein RhaS with RHS repeats
MVRYDYRQRYQSATEAMQALASLTNPQLARQANTGASDTLTLQPAPTQTTVTATLTSGQQTTLDFPTEPSISQVDSRDDNASVATSGNKSRRLMGIGTGIATAVALTVGISTFPYQIVHLQGEKKFL